jgi:hypothetical protein
MKSSSPLRIKCRHLVSVVQGSAWKEVSNPRSDSQEKQSHHCDQVRTHTHTQGKRASSLSIVRLFINDDQDQSLLLVTGPKHEFKEKTHAVLLFSTSTNCRALSTFVVQWFSSTEHNPPSFNPGSLCRQHLPAGSGSVRSEFATKEECTVRVGQESEV